MYFADALSLNFIFVKLRENKEECPSQNPLEKQTENRAQTNRSGRIFTANAQSSDIEYAGKSHPVHPAVIRPPFPAKLRPLAFTNREKAVAGKSGGGFFAFRFIRLQPLSPAGYDRKSILRFRSKGGYSRGMLLFRACPPPVS